MTSTTTKEIKRTVFTPAEVALLKEIFPTCATRAELQAAFPERTMLGIRCKAAQLGLRRDVAPMVYWTPAEDALLVQHYADKGTVFLAKRLNRTQQAIKQRASRLGIKCLLIGQPVKNPRVPAPTAHDPRPKNDHTLRPLAVGVQVDPVKRSPDTPTLNTRAEVKRRAEAAEKQKPKPYVTAEEIRSLSAAHPARLAWTRAAYNGPAAATAAFREAMNAYKQAA